MNMYYTNRDTNVRYANASNIKQMLLPNLQLPTNAFITFVNIQTHSNPSYSPIISSIISAEMPGSQNGPRASS